MSFAFWCYQTYKNGKYFISSEGKLLGHMLAMLRSEEQWPLTGILSYYTILQLEVLCKRIGKGNEVSYIETFMLLHLEERSQRVPTWDQKPLPWQDNFSVLISCMRLGVSPRLEVSDSNCTTGALGNFDSGDVDD